MALFAYFPAIMHLDTAPWGAACKAARLLSAPNHRMAEKTWEQTQP